jgi:hypothetical protein
MRQLLSWLTDTPTWNLRTQHCSPSCWLRAVERTTCIWRLLRCDRNFKTRKSRQIPPFVRAACCCHATLAIARVSLCPEKRKRRKRVSTAPCCQPTCTLFDRIPCPSSHRPTAHIFHLYHCWDPFNRHASSPVHGSDVSMHEFLEEDRGIEELARSVCYALGLFLPH